jgi:hypothetical protein
MHFWKWYEFLWVYINKKQLAITLIMLCFYSFD